MATKVHGISFSSQRRDAFMMAAMKRVMDTVMEQTPEEIAQKCGLIAEAMLKESDRLYSEEQERAAIVRQKVLNEKVRIMSESLGYRVVPSNGPDEFVPVDGWWARHWPWKKKAKDA